MGPYRADYYQDELGENPPEWGVYNEATGPVGALVISARNEDVAQALTTLANDIYEQVMKDVGERI